MEIVASRLYVACIFHKQWGSFELCGYRRQVDCPFNDFAEWKNINVIIANELLQLKPRLSFVHRKKKTHSKFMARYG